MNVCCVVWYSLCWPHHSHNEDGSFENVNGLYNSLPNRMKRNCTNLAAIQWIWSCDFKEPLTFCFVIKATLWLPVSCRANSMFRIETNGAAWHLYQMTNRHRTTRVFQIIRIDRKTYQDLNLTIFNTTNICRHFEPSFNL